MIDEAKLETLMSLGDVTFLRLHNGKVWTSHFPRLHAPLWYHVVAETTAEAVDMLFDKAVSLRVISADARAAAHAQVAPDPSP